MGQLCGGSTDEDEGGSGIGQGPSTAMMMRGGGAGSSVVTSADISALHLLRKMDTLLLQMNRKRRKKTMAEEVRSLQFWRAIIAECLASFFYVFLMCGCSVPWSSISSATPPVDINNPISPSSILQIAFTCGFAMATLVMCFGHISGAHVNPSVTLSLFITRKCTALRAFLYITAQCGGAIAGAALLYGVTVPGHQGTLGTMSINPALSSWQGFGIEFVLTFIIVFTVFATLDPQFSLLTTPSPIIGCAYLVCSLAALPSTGAALNPARALGPAFVMNKWNNHWIYWLGPLSGGLLSGLIYEYIFDPKKGSKGLREALDDFNKDSSVQSQEDDYDDIDAKTPKYSSPAYPSNANTYRTQPYDNYPRADDYRPNLSRAIGNGGNCDASRHVSNYGPLPSAGGGNYGIPQDNHPPSMHGGSASECAYGSRPYRCPSSASGTYATIHGNRPGTTSRVPQRLEYGPGSTKF